MVRSSIVAGILASLGQCAVAVADPAPSLPVDAFAHRPVMAGADLSPDGSHVAYLAPVGGRVHLVVRKLRPGPDDKPVVGAPSDSEIVGFDWVSNDRILIHVTWTENKMVGGSLGKIPLRFSRTISAPRDMTTTKPLVDRPPGNITRFFLTSTPILHFVDGENVLMAVPFDKGTDPGVMNVNVVTGRLTRVRKAVPRATGYLPDPTGEIRVATTYDDKTQTVRYLRRAANEQFEVMQTDRLTDGNREFSILGFDAAGKDLYVSSYHEGDRAAVYRYDMANDQIMEKVADHPQYDMGVLLDRGAVVAVQWTDDLPGRRWLDSNLQKSQDSLDKALPDSREIIIDTADGGNLLLVASYAINAPVTYRLFDRRAKTFEFFGDTYPAVPQSLVATQKPVSYKARDGQEIPAYLTLPVGVEGRNLPFLIMPHGGPFTRDNAVFDPLVQFLANRGYGVMQPNFRGSTGYGASFAEAGEQQMGGLMQDDVTDAAHWAIIQGYADPSRMCIAGWSYGGYAALMGAIKTPNLFKCAIATAPLANMERLHEELKYSDSKNLNRAVFFGDNPRNNFAVSPTHNAEKVNIPVLLIHGDLDYQVPVEHSRDMERALKKAGKSVEYIEIKDMDHSPLVTPQMKTVMEAWERFLKANIGGRS